MRAVAGLGLDVLVADDEASIRLLCRVNLESEGMSVVEAEDGERALELAFAAVPDVAVLDVMMPRLDGWAVARRLRATAETSNLAIVILTADTSAQAPRLAAELGALYVPKPFDPLRLASLVWRAAGDG